MIPIRDDNPYRQLPVITTCLIVINVAIYFYQLFVDKAGATFIYQYGAIPFQITHFQPVPHLPRGYHPPIPYFATIFTSMFIHGGFFHLFSNMLYLWIFGDNIENFLGPAKFILFYFLSGILAGLIHSMIYASSMVPTIGASGAIAGIMGAYFYLYPNAKVLALVFLFFYITIIPVPAFIFLGIWFLMQLLPAFVSFGKLGTGIAFWAHVGGFVAGIVLIILMGGRRRRGYYNSYWRRW